MTKKIVDKKPASVKPISVGWVCPKCGAVMSPWQVACVNCRGAKTYSPDYPFPFEQPYFPNDYPSPYRPGETPWIQPSDPDVVPKRQYVKFYPYYSSY
jgi:hypothetical protein